MKKALSLILVTACLLCLCACTTGGADAPLQTQPQEDTEQERRSNVIETDPENGQTYYLLGDFEDYYEATQIKYSADFGTVEVVNKEEQSDKVTNGNGSIHVTISGNESTWFKRRPNMRISTTSAFFSYTTDFSDMEKLTLDVYNCQDYEVEIRFYLSQSIDPRSTIEDRYFTNPQNPHTIIVSRMLQPGQWNHLEIAADEFTAVDYDEAGQRYSLRGAEALQVTGGFHITFDRAELYDVPQEFYIDNVRAYLYS